MTALVRNSVVLLALMGLFVSEARGSHDVIIFGFGDTVCAMVTFNGGGHGEEIHPENGYLIPGSGMRFPVWHTLNWGDYANNPIPPSVALWSNGPSAVITFDIAVSNVGFFYASLPDVTLEAFDARGNLVAVAFGDGNALPDDPHLRAWDLLTVAVSGDIIRWIRITGGARVTALDHLWACRDRSIEQLEVEIDTKPGSFPNSINLKSKGVLPVAILTTLEFDATNVDAATVWLGTTSPIRSTEEDVDNDGDTDLLLFFRVPDLVADGALDSDSAEAVLTGATFNGIPIIGSDSVRIVPRRN